MAPPWTASSTVTLPRNPCELALYVPSFAAAMPPASAFADASPFPLPVQPTSAPPAAPAAPNAAVNAAPLMKLRRSIAVPMMPSFSNLACGAILGGGRRARHPHKRRISSLGQMRRMMHLYEPCCSSSSDLSDAFVNVYRLANPIFAPKTRLSVRDVFSERRWGPAPRNQTACRSPKASARDGRKTARPQLCSKRAGRFS